MDCQLLWLTFRLSEQRLSQEALARERLAEKLRKRKQRRDGALEPVPNPATGDDVTSWQEAVAKEMELKHAEEREFLMNVSRLDLCASL